MKFCPTCGSDKREVKFTSHFSGMPILECSDPWHSEKVGRQHWMETELWNFAHALALDLALPKTAEDSIYRSMKAVIEIASGLAGCDSAKESAEPSKPTAQESMNVKAALICSKCGHHLAYHAPNLGACREGIYERSCPCLKFETAAEPRTEQGAQESMNAEQVVGEIWQILRYRHGNRRDFSEAAKLIEAYASERVAQLEKQLQHAVSCMDRSCKFCNALATQFPTAPQEKP